MLRAALARRHAPVALSRVALSPAREKLALSTTAAAELDPEELCPHALLRGIRSKGISRSVWESIRETAEEQRRTQAWRSGDLQEFGVDKFLQKEILDHRSLACGLASSVGGKLMANHAEGGVDFSAIFLSAFKNEPEIVTSVAADILRFKVVDPACPGLLGVYLFYKGVHALCSARVSHHFWTKRGEPGKLIARLLQSETSDVFGVDIHPGCKLGSGITIDHATGVVLGETAVIGDNVYLMHGRQRQSRTHPPSAERRLRPGNPHRHAEATVPATARRRRDPRRDGDIGRVSASPED